MKAIRHVPIAASFSFGWKKTWEHIGFILSFIAVGFVAQLVLGFLQAIGVGALNQAPGSENLTMLLMSLVRMIVNVVLGMAGINAVLQITGGKRVTLKSAFAGVTEVKMILNYLVMNFLIGIFVMIGLVLFIIPGIYLSLKYIFSAFALVDKRTNLGEAMNKSSDITDGVKWELIAFGIASFVVNVLGLLCLGVGLLITVPMTEIARGYVYRHLMKTG